MKTITILLIITAFSVFTKAQSVGIGTTTPNANAQLDITSSTKGVLIPRMNTAQMTALTSPEGLMIYNTDSAAFAYRNATAWVFLKGTANVANNWSTRGNAGTDTAKNFMGTTDDIDIIFKRNKWPAGLLGSKNTSWGDQALAAVTTGFLNTAVGNYALNYNQSGSTNTAVGYGTLFSNVSGGENVAIGSDALSSSTGNFNTAVGDGAGLNNITGNSNVFIGLTAGANEMGSNKLYIDNIGADANNALIYGEFDNKILRLNANVGIGQGTPQSLLHVRNANTNANSSQVIIEGNSNFGAASYAALEFRANAASAASSPAGRIKSYYTSNLYSDAKMTFQTIDIGPSFVDAMTLANGRVGIGTTTPTTASLVISNPLQNGIDLSSSNTYAEMRVIRNTLGVVDKDLYLAYGSPFSSAIHLFSAAAETMTIKNNEVGIGTSPAANTFKLAVKHENLGLQIQSASAGTSFWEIYQVGAASGNLLLYNGNGANVGSFNYTSGVYSATSDGRLKENIQLLGEVLPAVMKLQAKTYSYKADDKHTPNIGFIAQDVEGLFPQLVTPPMTTAGRTGNYTMNYAGFGVLAIQAIQEQQKIIQNQEERITALEEMVKKMTDHK